MQEKNLTETEAHKLLKQQAIRRFKKQGFKKEEIHIDLRRKHFGVFLKNIIEEKEVEVRKFLEEGYK